MKRAASCPPNAVAPPGASEAADAKPGAFIPEEWREFVEEMLVVGLAVEDIVEAVIAKGGERITAGAVLAHYRSQPELQKRRIEETVKGVGELRAALGNPEADQALFELANSALMVGYMGLTKNRANSITIKDAECIRLARENLKLRKRYLELKEIGEKRQNQVHWKRLRYEDVKHDKACLELKKLRKSLRGLMEQGKLDTDTLAKIKEIYGIVQQPFIEDLAQEPQA